MVRVRSLKVSLAEKIRLLHGQGKGDREVAEELAVPVRQVARVVWEEANKEHRRQWDRDRKRKQYNENIYLRIAKIEAVRARRKRAKAQAKKNTTKA